ncbi:solute carrier family 23 member 1-like [Pomacea canaliculata]|uniref:solute carrier family 23 member 1-like n=1 Tax=Pomacea canaliculata TaxID=400727 RepID=UPI000D73DF3D|nr:solute carrier family 23 member 1-like [Pomacea canaliculata]
MFGKKNLLPHSPDMRRENGVVNLTHSHSVDDLPLQVMTRVDSDPRRTSAEVTVQSEVSDSKQPSPSPVVRAEVKGGRNSRASDFCCFSSCQESPTEDTHVSCEEEGEEEGRQHHTEQERQLGILYSVTDVPPVRLCFLFGLQHVLLSISATISIPLIVSRLICADDLTLVKSEIMSTFLFMCGVCTILQSTLGVRLPIIQGGCHTFIPAIAALLSLQMWKCPDMEALTSANATEEITEAWQSRMREVQGGIMTASLAQVIIGCTGMLGLLLEYLGPITVVPTISLVGLSLVDVALQFCQKHWGITALTVGLVFLFSLYLSKVRVPFPSWTRTKGCRLVKYPIFMLFPVILAVVIAWAFSAILTATDTLKEPGVRTDSKFEVLQIAQWFFVPYPGQWGMPTVSLASFMAMFAATITSIIESVADYYACARISGVPPPPAHAVNRGIAIEGLGSLISGAVGSGGATTSYSQNVGAIGFTKVASRWAFVAAGIIFLVSGLCGKFGAFLTMLPDPVLGGIVLVSFGMVTSVGLSNLSFVDLSSGRNLCIIGSSLLVGLMVPRYLADHPDAIQTGNSDLDQVLKVLMGTAMFVGGALAFFLDLTVPGTPEERGIIKWRQIADLADSSQSSDNDHITANLYGFPCLAACLRRITCCSYVPFMPTFAFRRCSPFKRLCRRSRGPSSADN